MENIFKFFSWVEEFFFRFVGWAEDYFFILLVGHKAHKMKNSIARLLPRGCGLKLITLSRTPMTRHSHADDTTKLHKVPGYTFERKCSGMLGFPKKIHHFGLRADPGIRGGAYSLALAGLLGFGFRVLYIIICYHMIYNVQ